MNSLDKFQQLESLMMGYDRCTLVWEKELKKWALITFDKEKEAMLLDTDLDRLIRLLMHSDL